MDRFKNITALIQTPGTSLSSLLEKVAMLQKIQSAFCSHIDKHLQPYCQVANLSNQTLIVLVANGSVATQIRLQSYDLLCRFKKDPILRSIKAIHCKVSSLPPRMEMPAKQKAMTLLSEETAKLIADMAESLEDKELQAVMRRIGGRISRL